MRGAVAAVACASLLVVATAAAHVVARPAFAAIGAPTEIVLDVPNERAPATTTGLVIAAPAGVAIVEATAPAGWRATSTATTAAWSGGHISGTASVSFPLRLEASGTPRAVELRARQRYSDGEDVAFATGLTLVPGDRATSSSTRTLLGLAGALALVAATAGLVVVSRRRDRR